MNEEMKRKIVGLIYDALPIDHPELSDMILAVENAKVERHGAWVEDYYDEETGRVYCTCSQCLHVRTPDNYCPHCGAIMDLEPEAVKQNGRWIPKEPTVF